MHDLEGALPISGVHTMFYYEDLQEAIDWYDRIGFKNVLKLDFVSIFEIGPSSYLSLVDATGGSQRPLRDGNKGAMLSIETTNLELWHQTLFSKGIEGTGAGAEIGCGGRTIEFKLRDPGGYTLEFFEWL
ncbi:VOC family protein [Novosphingobium aquimarinum]|uniref:VOC family protein n=1 Tax=Novosphingobium aquimarinum TaxID=2682494 RepID=UPI0012EC6268|nr:VOC family protein [Novosphingobium aquimarinum]